MDLIVIGKWNPDLHLHVYTPSSFRVGGTFGSGDKAGGVSTLIFAALDDASNTVGLQR